MESEARKGTLLRTKNLGVFLLLTNGLIGGLLLFGNSSPAFGWSQITRPSRLETHSTTEKFCDAEVCPRQILFKVSECPAKLDPVTLQVNLQAVLRASVDKTIVINQVGSGCLFLAESAKLSVDRLISRFEYFLNYRTSRANRLLMLSGLEDIRFDDIEPNFKIQVPPTPSQKTSVEPNDDYFQQGRLWGLENRIYPGIDIDVLRAWTYSKPSSSVVVGVVDTGIAYGHPDLAANMWTARRTFTVRLGGRTITCKKGSVGFDALAKTKSQECYPVDGDGHGTQVAGIIGAVGDNGVGVIGVVGVNPYVKLMSLRFLDSSGQGCISGAINAIEFALQAQEQLKSEANLRVLNNSWGYINSEGCSVESKALRDIVEKANRQDIVFVASAGEDNKVTDEPAHYPSGFYELPNVLSVTAIERDGALTVIKGIRSNLGKKSVHLAAPGHSIWSTCLPYQRYYCEQDFTSAAAPFVSGGAALMWSIPSCARHRAAGIRTKILEGAVETPSMIDPITKEKLTVTGGRLNLYKAILACSK